MWKHTSFIKNGLSHERLGNCCQDSVLVRETEHCIIAAVSDGLGSLPNSHIASATATQGVWDIFSSLGKTTLVFTSEEEKQEFAARLAEELGKRIRAAAARQNLSADTMDCTLGFVYISKVHNYAIIGRLGDSAICVIMEDDAIAINDGGYSANGTSAMLDRDAGAQMQITVWHIPQQKIRGFVLCSDGLDGEIYMKGSPHVKKVTELYFNAVQDPEDPQRAIRERVALLTADADSSFGDDISVAVVSREEGVITLPGDPTWLCTCEHRNRLQDTYCVACGKDFIKLYRGVRFREHGGKSAFFLKLNADPEAERRLIGLVQPEQAPEVEISAEPAVQPEQAPEVEISAEPAVQPEQAPEVEIPAEPAVQPEQTTQAEITAEPAVQPLQAPETLPETAGLEELEADLVFPTRRAQPQPVAEPTEQTQEAGLQTQPVMPNAEINAAPRENARRPKRRRRWWQIFGIICAALVALASLIGSGLQKINYVETVQKLEKIIVEQENEIHRLKQAQEETTPEQTDRPQGPSWTFPDDFTQLADGRLWWGELSGQTLNGPGICLENGYYYMGTFRDGQKIGRFVVFPEASFEENLQLVYDDAGNLQEPDARSEKYRLQTDHVMLKTNPGLDSNVVCFMSRGEIVYVTHAEPVRKDGRVWVEVIYNSTVGWAEEKSLEAES